MNLLFKNPVGLAAGFDKNAELLNGIELFGFGFVEIGTVTPLAQEGNPKPRVFRDKTREALINRMGFPNEGMSEIAKQLRSQKRFCTIPVGVNIGKNKSTPNENASDDYIKCMKEFSDTADYFTLNLSSPNTPGLRSLQKADFLVDLDQKISELKIFKPIFIKLAPEIDIVDLKEISALCSREKTYTGLILTNTIATDLGGISGKPLTDRSFQVLKMARSFLKQDVPVISVGGIFDSAEARSRLQAGASAVQIYTSIIYEGPSVVKSILQNI